MIGDDAEADVAGVIKAGIGAGIIVRTGKYRLGDEARFIRPPTATVADLVTANDLILAQSQ
jgi:ribonucleotide monophosphatase NagD (HAD superfamily)